jgi:hypothetical protein
MEVAVMNSKLRSFSPIVILYASILFVGCKMPISMDVTTTLPPNETITFDQDDDVVIAPGSMLQVAISESFNSYQWMLDGAVLVGQTSAVTTVDSTSLPLGVHHLSALVEKNELRYSGTLRFFVEN